MSGATGADLHAGGPESALRALGVRCAVEARGKLALVVPGPGERALEDPSVRRAVLAALRAHGFTHAAFEPPDDRESAPGPGPSTA